MIDRQQKTLMLAGWTEYKFVGVNMAVIYEDWYNGNQETRQFAMELVKLFISRYQNQ